MNVLLDRPNWSEISFKVESETQSHLNRIGFQIVPEETDTNDSQGSSQTAATARAHRRVGRVHAGRRNSRHGRDDGARTLLFDRDSAIQRVDLDTPAHAAVMPLTGVVHNLLRRWAKL
jgi:hypothetical protein